MIPLDYNAVVEDFIKMADIEETEVLRFEVTIDECITRRSQMVCVSHHAELLSHYSYISVSKEQERNKSCRNMHAPQSCAY